MDTQVVFKHLATVNSAIVNVHARYLSESLFPDLSDIHLGWDLLGQVVILCLTILGHTKLPSAEAAPFCICTSQP